MSSAGSGSVGAALQAAAAWRLGLLCLTLLGVTGTLRTYEVLTVPSTSLPAPVRWLLLAASLSFSLGLFAAIRSKRLAPSRAITWGLFYEVAQGLLLAIGYHATSLAPGTVNRGWTPIAVWAMVYPLVVPSSTPRVVIATMFTTAMDPLGLWINVAAGAPAPSTASFAMLFLPTLVVCIAAPLVARIVYGLSVDLTRAQEMGSYHLVDRLGSGGMGEVWRAEHRMLARPAALKLIKPEYLGSEPASRAAAISRFTKEARATAALRSPHTVSVYDFGVTDEGAFFYVMELLDGVTLEDLVKAEGALPPTRAVYLLRQVCHSLDEAHGAGMIHRDIKPDNIFVCRVGCSSDFVKVLDFGLVKDMNTTDSIAGMLFGTPQFLAPELATGVSPADARSDIYSLGCVAYWLLSGQKVFDADSTVGVLLAHVRATPTPLRKRSSRPVPPALEAVVMACLEKEPAKRPANVAELERRLKRSIESDWEEDYPGDWLGLHGSLVPAVR